MYIWLLIGFGGFLGAIIRYLLSGWVQNRVAGGFPFGTLSVNFLGSFLLSLVMYLSEYFGMFDRETRIFLTIGILGSFTTMSTFSYEAFRMLEQGDTLPMILYIAGTVMLGIVAVYLGKMLALELWRV